MPPRAHPLPVLGSHGLGGLGGLGSYPCPLALWGAVPAQRGTPRAGGTAPPRSAAQGGLAGGAQLPLSGVVPPNPNIFVFKEKDKKKPQNSKPPVKTNLAVT